MREIDRLDFAIQAIGILKKIEVGQYTTLIRSEMRKQANELLQPYFKKNKWSEKYEVLANDILENLNRLLQNKGRKL